tara:strand:- start:3831 stop:4313 length:483 start_codon:yes stop_codon:yes gene_type:complete
MSANNPPWFTGDGKRLSFSEVVNIVKEHAERNGKVTIGTDSATKKAICQFATSICLVSADDQVGGRFFVKKTKYKSKKFATIHQRITLEVTRSIGTGLKILKQLPFCPIELHLDVSGVEKGTKTSKLSTALMGYANGSGFECKIKPEAYAATSVANRYSK